MNALDFDDLNRGPSGDLFGDLDRAERIGAERRTAETVAQQQAEREERRLGPRRLAEEAKEDLQWLPIGAVPEATRARLVRNAIEEKGGKVPALTLRGVEMSSEQVLTSILGLLAGAIIMIIGSALGVKTAALEVATPIAAVFLAAAFVRVKGLPLIEEILFRVNERRRENGAA